MVGRAHIQPNTGLSACKWGMLDMGPQSPPSTPELGLGYTWPDWDLSKSNGYSIEGFKLPIYSYLMTRE